MRIKFLSRTAGLFMMSLAVSACLDNDNQEIEYSPDATIHAFELDTIGYGTSYKFTIDQLKGEIYNEDSLPVHADTIIDKIIIKTLTTTSGVVTMKSSTGNDSVINISDSIDLRKPLKLKVWSTEALAGVSADQVKEYTISVRIHRHDPDSLRWSSAGIITTENLTGRQRVALLGDEILTYAVVDNVLKAYRSSKGDAMNWTEATLGTHPFGNALPASLLSYGGKLYATPEPADGKAYESVDGATWVASTLFGDAEVSLLLAPMSDRITFIKVIDDKKYFAHTLASASGTQLQEVPQEFPVGNISHTAYTTATGKEGVMLVGTYDVQPTIDQTATIVPWGYMGDIWTPFPPNNTDTACPVVAHPSIVCYNGKFYIFGEQFATFYTSVGGIAWRKADTKFSFPYQSWETAGFVPDMQHPEFRGRGAYAAVADPESHYIYVLFGKGNAGFDTHSYTHGAEAWRARLNLLWFQLANNSN